MEKGIVTEVIKDGEVKDVYSENDNLVVRVIYLERKKTEVDFRRIVNSTNEIKNNNQIN